MATVLSEDVDHVTHQSHVKSEVCESSSTGEYETSQQHRAPGSDQPADEARERHEDTLGHPPHTLNYDEVCIGQVWRSVLSEREIQSLRLSCLCRKF